MVPLVANTCPVGHQGLLFDKEFGLYYNRARYYHPRLMRFLSVDPKGYVDGMSLYEYVHSAPTMGLDPSGLRDVTINIMVHFTQIKLTTAMKVEVDRILQAALASRVPKDAQGQPEHIVTILWTAVQRRPDEKQLGKKGSPPSAVTLNLHDGLKLPAMGQGGGNRAGLNPNVIEDEWREVDREATYDDVVATVIAHELFHHCMGGAGIRVHHNQSGNTDSATGAVKSTLSKPAADKLARFLEVDRK